MPRPPLSPIERAKGQSAALRGNLFANIGQFIVVGPMMMLYANDVLAMSPSKISSILALAPLVGVMSLPLLGRIRRYGKVRTFRLASSTRIAVVIALAFIPVQFLNFPLYLLLLLIFSGAQQIGVSTIWQPLIRDITTKADRGRFFGRMRASFTIVSTIVTTLIAVYIGDTLSDVQYRVLLAVTVLGMVNQFVWLSRIPEIPFADDGSEGDDRSTVGDLRRLWQVARQAPALRVPLLVQGAIIFSTAPVMVLYLRRILHVPSNLVSYYLVAMTLGTAISLLLWGKVSDAVGFRPMLTGIAGLFVVISPLHLLLVPLRPETSLGMLNGLEVVTLVMLVFLGLAKGAAYGGMSICTTSILHFHTRRDDSVETMTVYQIFMQGCMALAALVSGWLLNDIALPSGPHMLLDGHMEIDWFKAWLVVVTPALMIVVMVMVRRLPNSQPHFGVSDFFSTIIADPVRTIVASRHVYHEDEDRRTELARWFGNRVNPMSIEPLIDMLHDPSYDVRVEAVRSLGRTGSPAAGERLLDMLQNEEMRHLADHVAWSLGELAYLPAYDALAARLREDYPVRLRAMAARALGKLGDPRAVPLLAETIAAQPASLHIVSSCCRALLRLEGLQHANLVFASVHLLTSRSERYELLAVICDWLDIPSQWLLRSSPSAMTSEALQGELELRSLSWREQRAPAIAAFQARDAATVVRLLRERLAARPQDEKTTVLDSLAAELEAADSWSTLHILALAWLMLV